MTTINEFSRAELSDHLGFADHLKTGGDAAPPSPWGIARFIRREVRRRGLVTRRELRKVIEPFLAASGFDFNPTKMIRGVAQRMVDVGELGDLRVENQRGYSAMPNRWVKLNSHEAVLLGTTATETHRFSPSHPHQFLRRFRPSDRIINDLERIGVKQQSFSDWLGEPGWKDLVETGDRIDSLQDLLNWYVARLEEDGAPFSPNDTKVLAIDRRVGEFLGMPRTPGITRWNSPSQLGDGIYVGAQPDDRHERIWHPLLLQIAGDTGRTFLINFRNDAQLTFELRNWLLVAIAAQQGLPEQVRFDHDANEVEFTFQLPKKLKRCLDLAGEWCRGWTYKVLDSRTLQNLLSESFPEIDFVAR